MLTRAFMYIRLFKNANQIPKKYTNWTLVKTIWLSIEVHCQLVSYIFPYRTREISLYTRVYVFFFFFFFIRYIYIYIEAFIVVIIFSLSLSITVDNDYNYNN